MNEQQNKNKFFLKNIFFYSSVSIVCMVNPDADNATVSQSTDSAAIQRNIPASCHKHSVQKSRTVRIYFLIRILI